MTLTSNLKESFGYYPAKIYSEEGDIWETFFKSLQCTLCCSTLCTLYYYKRNARPLPGVVNHYAKNK